MKCFVFFAISHIVHCGVFQWVKEEGEEGSPKRSTPVKIDHPNQFAPQGSDPREFKQKQKQVRIQFFNRKCNNYLSWMLR